jgi:predicted nucleic acid-binding protein
MAGKKYLIDTNVVIEYIGEALPSKALSFLDDIIDGQFHVSVINKFELLGFTGIIQLEEQKFGVFLKAANVCNLDEEVVNRTIEIRKQYKTKLPDAIIAATALKHDLVLITRNAKDFQKIKGLTVQNPHDILK